MSGIAYSAYNEGRDAAASYFLKYAQGGRSGAIRSFFETAKDKALRFGTGQLDAAKNLFKNVSGGLGINMDPEISARAHEILGNIPGAASMQWDDLSALQRAAHRAEAIRHFKKLAPTVLTAAGAYGTHKALRIKDDLDQYRLALEQQAVARQAEAYRALRGAGIM